MSETKNNKPVFKTRVGAISGDVWENEGKEGNFLTISTQRSYKDKKDAWQTTNSLRVTDVADMKLVLDKCYEYIKVSSKEKSE